MKVTLFGLLAYGVGLVSAYGSYGAYERMYFYYAYTIDAELNGNGGKLKIAPGCKKGGVCSFDEFVGYINNLDKTPSITKEKHPPVDATADKLVSKQLTGEYNQDKILPGTGTGSGKIPVLFDKISLFLEGNVGRLPKDANGKSDNVMLRNARAAIQRVEFLRGFEQSKAMKADLEKSGIKVATKTKQLTDGKGVNYEFVDVAETKKNNPGKKVGDLITKFRKDDPSHDNNVLAAARARGNLGGCPKRS